MNTHTLSLNTDHIDLSKRIEVGQKGKGHGKGVIESMG